MVGKTFEAKGMSSVEKYYQVYTQRTRELKGEGRGIIGYLCALTPAEIITAAGLIPFRIKGGVREPVTKADAQMETLVCPLVRSCFDVTLKGTYDFLDGLVIPHACDSIARTYEIWKYNLQLPFSHYVNLPHTTSSSSLEFFKAELELFRKRLAGFVGREITDDDLIKAIKAHNQNRAQIKKLYGLRKSDPPLISGVEMTMVLVAAMGLPVEESTQLVSSVVEQVEQRGSSSSGKLPRLMVLGGQIDDIAFIELVESSGATVVTDELCPGTREYRPEVDTDKNPIDGLAERYLVKLSCSRTHRVEGETYHKYVEAMFGDIGHSVKDFKVDGVILYIYKYCDPLGFDAPVIKGYIESLGIPVLHLEDEYSIASVGRLRTRVQAFLEMIKR